MSVVLPSDRDLQDFVRCIQRLEVIGQPRYRFRLRLSSDFDNNRNRYKVVHPLNNPTSTCPITPICQDTLRLHEYDDQIDCLFYPNKRNI